MTDDTRTRIDAAILAWEDQNDIHDPEAAATAGCAAADLLREVRDLARLESALNIKENQ